METGRVTAVVAQVAPGTPLSYVRELLTRHPAEFYALPEYLTAGRGEADQADTARHHEADLRAIRELSRELDAVVLGGTVVQPVNGGYANVAPCFERGELRGVHWKVHPTSRERERGIVRGAGFRAIEAGGLRLSTLICADVLHPDSFAAAAEQRPDVLFVPTTSPHRPGEGTDEKSRRDREIFLAGAARARGFVLKACAVGTVYGVPLQGRSLVAAPWGEILARVPPTGEAEERVLTVDLDLDRLRRWRHAT